VRRPQGLHFPTRNRRLPWPGKCPPVRTRGRWPQCRSQFVDESVDLVLGFAGHADDVAEIACGCQRPPSCYRCRRVGRTTVKACWLRHAASRVDGGAAPCTRPGCGFDRPAAQTRYAVPANRVPVDQRRVAAAGTADRGVGGVCGRSTAGTKSTPARAVPSIVDHWKVAGQDGGCSRPRGYACTVRRASAAPEARAAPMSAASRSRSGRIGTGRVLHERRCAMPSPVEVCGSMRTVRSQLLE
jgi:hypothetical protein